MAGCIRHYVCTIRAKSGGHWLNDRRLPAAGLLRFEIHDPVEDRRNVTAKLVGILTHWKMTELLHDGDAGAGNGGRGSLRIFRRAGEIILAGEQKQRAYFSIEPLDLPPEIAVDPVKIEVSLEHARPALLVGP